MRIYGPNGTTLGSPASNIKRTTSSGFSLPDDAAATAETRATIAPKASANIDALLALQGGGYGVQVVTGKTSHLAAVTTGLYSDTLVQVSGSGITAGTLVEVPSS